jgi:hypothetical protein
VNGAEGAGSYNDLDELVPWSLARNHWGRWGPVKAERKVRGEPEGLRFKIGAEEEEADE